MKRDGKGFLFKFKFIPSFNNSNNSKKKKSTKTWQISLTMGSLSASSVSRNLAPMATADQDASWRGSIHIWRPRPLPSHQPSPWWQAIQKAGKINEVSRTGTKGCHEAQGFGGMGINHIMEGNSTLGSLVLGRRDSLPRAFRRIVVKHVRLLLWLPYLYHPVSKVDH